MSNQKRKKRSVNAPVVPFFLAAVVGIWIDDKFALGLSFWRFSFWIAVFLLIIFALLGNFRFWLYSGASKANCSNSFRWNFLVVNACAWIAFASAAGFRYDRFYNYYPNTEIGRYVPKEGVQGVLKLQILNTPRLYLRKEVNRAFGQSPYVTVFNAKATAAKNEDVWRDYTGKIAVSVDSDATYLHVGDKIEASGELTLPTSPANPGARDNVLYYRSQRILTLLNVSSLDRITLEEEQDPSWLTRTARYFERLRLRCGAVLSSYLKPRNAAVARGMTLGFRSDVDEETNDAFRSTGTIHLLAISGLHIALVVGAFVFALRRLGTPNVVVALLTIGLVLFYIALTDMRAPVIRAAVLIVVSCVGTLIARRPVTLNSLAFAALVILAINPCELFQLGAQLSFLATGAFLWSTHLSIRDKAESNSFRREAVRERRRLMEKDKQKKKACVTQPSDDNRVKSVSWFHSLRTVKAFKALIRRMSISVWGQVCAVTKAGCAIWTVGTPLILRTTNLFTPIAIVANPLIWLPATIALLLAFLLILVGTCEYIAPYWARWIVTSVACLTNGAFDFFLGVLDFFAAPSFGSIRTPAPQEWTLWLFYTPLVICTLFPKFRPGRRTLLLCLTMWIIVAVQANVFKRIAFERSDTLRCDVLSIGHGCATLCVFPDGRSFLYDCGSISNSERVAQTVAKDLWESGRGKIDLAVISHADYDHYGGLTELSELVDINCVCVSDAMFRKSNRELNRLKATLEEKEIPIEIVSAGDSLAPLGFPEVTVLHPSFDSINDEDFEDESNANSVVVAIEHLRRRILLPGDLDSDDARFLEDAPWDCDVMLSPHHGGKSSNYRELLDWATPETIIISGGTFQRNVEVENELKEQGYVTKHTRDDGCVRIEIKRDPTNEQGALSIAPYRDRRNF